MTHQIVKIEQAKDYTNLTSCEKKESVHLNHETVAPLEYCDGCHVLPSDRRQTGTKGINEIEDRENYLGNKILYSYYSCYVSLDI